MKGLLTITILFFHCVKPYTVALVVNQQYVTFCVHEGNHEKSRTEIMKHIKEANEFAKENFDVVILTGPFRFLEENVF
ncbi:hypothetical protein MHBO_004029 [Bonamia ostreae]|uniref:Uncharacterized protein n=1 Tax=Bonamia ostreae TaxID=126728 RepID=A0ABV2AS70_9EUKA